MEWVICMSKIINIVLDLHKCDQFMVLNSCDILEYINENNENDIKFVQYVEKWCEYLNLGVTDNEELKFGNPHRFFLSGWTTGYETAMGYKTKRNMESLIIQAKRKYCVELKIPYKIVDKES